MSYAGYTGWEIFDRMNANPQTTGTLDAAQRTTLEISSSYKQLSDALTKAQGSLGSFWQGNGSESAQSGLNPLINSVNDSATKLDATQNAYVKLNHVFHEVRGNLIGLGDRPNTSDAIYASYGTRDYEQDALKWDADAQKNVTQYNLYATAAREYSSEANIPSNYVSVNDPTDNSTTPSGSVGQGTDQPGGRAGSSGGVNQLAGYNGPGGTSNPNGGFVSAGYAGGIPGQAGNPAAPGQSGVGAFPGGQGTGSAGYRPPPPVSPIRGGANYPNGGTGNGVGPNGENTNFGPGWNNAPVLGGASAYGSAGSGGNGAGGYGGRGGGAGALGGGSGSGANGGASIRDSMQSGKSVGIGTAAEGGAYPGGGTSPAGAKGGASGMGGMPMGGGGARREEDEEHQRQFLYVEPVDAIVGKQEPTAPAVIGE